MTAHWGIEDTAAVPGTALDRERAFVLAFEYLKNRIGLFPSLPLVRIDRLGLGTRLREIGRSERATVATRRAS